MVEEIEEEIDELQFEEADSYFEAATNWSRNKVKANEPKKQVANIKASKTQARSLKQANKKAELKEVDDFHEVRETTSVTGRFPYYEIN